MFIIIEIVIESILTVVLYFCECKSEVGISLYLTRLVLLIIISEFIELVLEVVTLQFYDESQWSYIKYIIHFRIIQ